MSAYLLLSWTTIWLLAWPWDNRWASPRAGWSGMGGWLWVVVVEGITSGWCVIMSSFATELWVASLEIIWHIVEPKLAINNLGGVRARVSWSQLESPLSRVEEVSRMCITWHAPQRSTSQCAREQFVSVSVGIWKRVHVCKVQYEVLACVRAMRLHGELCIRRVTGFISIQQPYSFTLKLPSRIKHTCLPLDHMPVAWKSWIMLHLIYINWWDYMWLSLWHYEAFFSQKKSSFLGSFSSFSLGGLCWKPHAWSQIAPIECKQLIGYQTSGEEKVPPLCVSFIIHSQQMKLVQWEQSIIDERR